jgi:hypothetical protein
VSKNVILLDCSACKTPESMKATKVARFGTFIRLLGVVIVIPSIFGALAGIALVLSVSITASDQLAHATSQAATAGTAIGAGIGYGFAFGLSMLSLVGGLVGWLLLTKRNVYKCGRCGFILERA